jgi:dipeptidyl aminopeptidase/acylaminoacyl peptidase
MTAKLRRRLALGTALAALSTVALAAEPPLNESVRQVRDLREAALSPDASQVAAVIAEPTADGGRSHVWILGADGKSSRQITYSQADSEPGESRVAWSSDGRTLFFFAKRGKAQRLYRLPMSGGEAEALTLARPAKGAAVAGWSRTVEDAVDVQPQSYEVSPDGKTIAILAADGDTAEREAQIKKKDDAVRVGRDDVQKARLYLIDVAAGSVREVELTDTASFARFSPDSSELAVITSPAPAEEDIAPGSRVWRVKAQDGSSHELAGFPKTTSEIGWASQGFVYLAQCQADAPPGCSDLYAWDGATRASRNLTAGLQGTLTRGLTMEKGGAAVDLLVQKGVRQLLARIDVSTGALTWVEGPQPVIMAAQANRAGTDWALIASGPTQPRAAYVMTDYAKPEAPLQAPAMVPADWPKAPSQLLTWKNQGVDIEGLLYLPKLAAGAHAPLVVIVHGGPTGAFLDRYTNLVNLLIGQGWAVLETNPRGSTGYGTAFEAANKNDLGGADYQDIMSGVDAALAKCPLDKDRMALIGYSYGGEMAGFVEGRTDRFKAIVSGAPVIDQFSEYGTEDGSYYDRWFYGKPWDHFEDVWRQSPLAKVGAAKTPFLLIQGQDDPTDPLGQAQEMRRALAQVGAPVTLVTYPRETHATLGRGFAAESTREPWHGQDVRRRMINFIADAFAGKHPASDSP